MGSQFYYRVDEMVTHPEAKGRNQQQAAARFHRARP